MSMTLTQARQVARYLWTGPGTEGIIQRLRKGACFVVGWTAYDGRTLPAIEQRSWRSSVDWESAFALYIDANPHEKERVITAMIKAGVR